MMDMWARDAHQREEETLANGFKQRCCTKKQPLLAEMLFQVHTEHYFDSCSHV